jgi:SNF2 family DNA or RNA helicase
LFELIKTILNKKEKLIIVVEWLDLFKIVQDKCKELEVPHFIIEGQTKSPERKTIECLLNEPENETRVLITTRKCLFYETLFGVKNIIYLNATENPESE